MNVGAVNSQQLWLPVQILHRATPVNFPTEEGPQKLTHCLRTYSQLICKYETIITEEEGCRLKTECKIDLEDLEGKENVNMIKINA